LVGLYIDKASADLITLGQMGRSLSSDNPNAYPLAMVKFLKNYIQLFKESSIVNKFNLLLAALMVPLFTFVGIDYFIEFLNREPTPPKPIPLSDSELFQMCMDSIKDYEDPRFDSAVEGCMDIGLYRE
jgi:hypothetical protein